MPVPPASGILAEMKESLISSWHKRFFTRFRAFMRKRTVRGFSHVLFGNLLVTFSQGLQFLLLVRVLGPNEFGRIAAVSSVSAVLLPFAGMGAGNVMIMRASRNRSLLPLYFGNALILSIVTGLFLSVFSALVITPFLGSKGSFLVMLTFCLSELIFSKIIDICGQVFITNERLRWTSIFMTVQSFSKLTAVLIFMSQSGGLASVWVWWALSSNCVAAAWIVFATVRQIGPPNIDLALAGREFTGGVPFAIGISAKGFYTDADKVFLARYGAAQSVGMYTVAFRVAQMALVPIRAVSYVTQAKYFRAGESGVEGSAMIALRLSRVVIPMAVALGAAFYVAAPLVTLAAGHQYAESAHILRWLFALPILLGGQSLLSDTLASGGRQRITASIQVLSAALACVLCVILVPRLDWRGAVAASYLSQLFLFSMLLGAVLVLRRRRLGDAKH
jgi:O-antigen/teichoic acid export membrane protein